jgi:hypothetical protein
MYFRMTFRNELSRSREQRWSSKKRVKVLWVLLVCSTSFYPLKSPTGEESTQIRVYRDSRVCTMNSVATDNPAIPAWKKKLLEKKETISNDPNFDPTLPAWKQSLLQKKAKEAPGTESFGQDESSKSSQPAWMQETLKRRANRGTVSVPKSPKHEETDDDAASEDKKPEWMKKFNKMNFRKVDDSDVLEVSGKQDPSIVRNSNGVVVHHVGPSSPLNHRSQDKYKKDPHDQRYTEERFNSSSNSTQLNDSSSSLVLNGSSNNLSHDSSPSKKPYLAKTGIQESEQKPCDGIPHTSVKDSESLDKSKQESAQASQYKQSPSTTMKKVHIDNSDEEDSDVLEDDRPTNYRGMETRKTAGGTDKDGSDDDSSSEETPKKAVIHPSPSSFTPSGNSTTGIGPNNPTNASNSGRSYKVESKSKVAAVDSDDSDDDSSIEEPSKKPLVRPTPPSLAPTKSYDTSTSDKDRTKAPFSVGSAKAGPKKSVADVDSDDSDDDSSIEAPPKNTVARHSQPTQVSTNSNNKSASDKDMTSASANARSAKNPKHSGNYIDSDDSDDDSSSEEPPKKPVVLHASLSERQVASVAAVIKKEESDGTDSDDKNTNVYSMKSIPKVRDYTDSEDESDDDSGSSLDIPVLSKKDEKRAKPRRISDFLSADAKTRVPKGFDMAVGDLDSVDGSDDGTFLDACAYLNEQEKRQKARAAANAASAKLQAPVNNFPPATQTSISKKSTMDEATQLDLGSKKHKKHNKDVSKSSVEEREKVHKGDACGPEKSKKTSKTGKKETTKSEKKTKVYKSGKSASAEKNHKYESSTGSTDSKKIKVAESPVSSNPDPNSPTKARSEKKKTATASSDGEKKKKKAKADKKEKEKRKETADTDDKSKLKPDKSKRKSRRSADL